MRNLIGIVLLMIGIVIGFALPDSDLQWGFLGHRSIVTHGLLMPTLLYWLVRRREHVAARLLAIGVCLSSAIHLSFDLFPRAWTGFALIYIPLYGRTSPVFSWLWIAASITACMYFSFALGRNLVEVVVTVGGLVVAFGVYATQQGVFWPALIALAATTAAALALRSAAGKVLKGIRKKRGS